MAIINNLSELIHEDDPNTNGLYYKLVQAASGATTELVAAVTGSKIRVLQVVFQTDTIAASIQFKTATTAISPVWSSGLDIPWVLPFSPMGWFETISGDALQATTVTDVFNIQIGYALVQIE